MNKELLEPIMRAHGDRNKDLAAAIGMSVPNFSTIWNGRGEFGLKYIRRICPILPIKNARWVFLPPGCFSSKSGAHDVPRLVLFTEVH